MCSDALNFSLSIDNHTADMWKPLQPHKNVLVLNEPRKLSANISLPKTVVATIANWASSRRGYDFTEAQLARFNALPEAPLSIKT